MVTAIIGLPGSGKSTLLSYLAFSAINGDNVNKRCFHISTCKNYDYVFTNFPCSGAYKLDFDMLGTAKYEKSMIFCDEIQLFAESRNFKNFTDRLNFWFTNHRKFQTDFCYCTQDFSFVDKKIRCVTDRIYIVDMLPFHIIRVRQVLTGLNWSDLSQRYEPSSGLNCSYFFAPRLYKYNDTFALCKEINFMPTPLVPWFGENKEFEEITESTNNNVESC